MDISKILKLGVLASLMISALLIGYSIYYHYVVYLSNKATQEGLQQTWESVDKNVDLEEVRKAYSECSTEAAQKARELLNNKIEASEASGIGLSSELTFYKEMAKRGSYLITDYENAYKNCLRSRGIQE